MKTVLILAYYFPPMGGGGVQRTVKFARYLSEFGYRPVIVTGSGTATDDTVGEDPTLAAELPPDLEVLRIRAQEPRSSSGNQARLERWLRVRSPWTKWWTRGALEAGTSARDVDVVMATMSPFESTETAARLAARLGVPWVADLRDPWALDEMFVWPTVLHRLAERRRMRRALAGADGVIMNTPEAGRALTRLFPEFRTRRVEVIPNGYDPADFAAPAPLRTDRNFNIVHTGFLHTEAGGRRLSMRLHKVLGGANADVDYLTRSHVFLLGAVDRLLARMPELEEVVQVHLVGQHTAADRHESMPFVREHGYLPHDESIAMMRSADLLFLPMHDLPPGTRARIVPGKTYEYLATGRPILAAVPDGDARDLLTRSGRALIARPDEVDAMERLIFEQIQRRDNANGAAPDPGVLAQYERRELTRRLCHVLDAAVDARRPSEVESHAG